MTNAIEEMERYISQQKLFNFFQQYELDIEFSQNFKALLSKSYTGNII